MRGVFPPISFRYPKSRCVSVIRIVGTKMYRLEFVFCILLVSGFLFAFEAPFSRPSVDDYPLYGSKTTFWNAYKHFSSFYKVGPKHIARENEPSMFFYFGRHSIRYPSKKQIIWMSSQLPELVREVSAAHEAGKGSLSWDQIDRLQKWKPRMTEKKAKLVSSSGELETSQIAQMYFEAFPSLLNASKVELKVGITDKIRTRQTAEAFLTGLKHMQGGFNVSIEDRKPLYLYRLCKNELKRTEKHRIKPKGQTKELLYSSVNTALKSRLGLDREFSHEEMKLLHITCAFEVAIYNDSTWCAVFDEPNLKRMEYIHDLHYVNKDHGRYYNGNATCDIFKDLVSTIRSQMDPSRKPLTKLYFSHSGAMVKLWSTLGVFNEKRPLNGFMNDPNRYLRTSLVDPFNSHFIVTMFRKNDKYHIVPMVQGYPITIDGCSELPCSVEKFLQHYEELISQCIIDNICPINHRESKNESSDSSSSDDDKED